MLLPPPLLPVFVERSVKKRDFHSFSELTIKIKLDKFAINIAKKFEASYFIFRADDIVKEENENQRQRIQQEKTKHKVRDKRQSKQNQPHSTPPLIHEKRERRDPLDLDELVF